MNLVQANEGRICIHSSNTDELHQLNHSFCETSKFKLRSYLQILQHKLHRNSKFRPWTIIWKCLNFEHISEPQNKV